MTQYVLLNSDKVILNKVVYDPKGDWKPPTGQTIGAIPDNIELQLGGKWDGKTYTEPVQEETPDDVIKEFNKDLAKRMLTESDWVGLADAREKLSNVSEWDTYRSSLRDYIINPKTGKPPKKPKTVTWKE
tara:strand:- start:81 stop:470 length:390 start_codon:yes stop_codon:yes gene_type:complete